MEPTESTVQVPAGGVRLPGILGLPATARGIILFAHGSGSGRLSPRNNAVARWLQRAGFATLLLDLLTEPESLDRSLVFDIGFLADRLRSATEWAAWESSTAGLPAAYFGASTGGGAALVAAAREGAEIRAVVSRGGRPDLAGASLEAVRAPTLLIVGGTDRDVLLLNEWALERLSGIKRLEVVPGATHLFEEPGALDQVCSLATEWFLTYVS